MARAEPLHVIALAATSRRDVVIAGAGAAMAMAMAIGLANVVVLYLGIVPVIALVTRDAELHRRMAVMRAVEGGFALVRSARNGYLSVHDAWGRLLAEQPSSSTEVALEIVDVPVIARHPLMLAAAFGVAMIVVALGCGALCLRHPAAP